MHDPNGVSDAEKFELTDWHLKLVLVTGVLLVGATLLAYAAGYVIMHCFLVARAQHARFLYSGEGRIANCQWHGNRCGLDECRIVYFNGGHHRFYRL